MSTVSFLVKKIPNFIKLVKLIGSDRQRKSKVWWLSIHTIHPINNELCFM